MEIKDKWVYEAPETDIIQVRTEHSLLQASDPLRVNNYDSWEEESI